MPHPGVKTERVKELLTLRFSSSRCQFYSCTGMYIKWDLVHTHTQQLCNLVLNISKPYFSTSKTGILKQTNKPQHIQTSADKINSKHGFTYEKVYYSSLQILYETKGRRKFYFQINRHLYDKLYKNIYIYINFSDPFAPKPYNDCIYILNTKT